MIEDPRLDAMPDVHGHAKGEHKPFAEERPIALSARMLFLWFFHACRRGGPRFLMVSDHMNYLTFEDPAAVNLVRRALKLAAAGDLYGAAETAGVEVGHTAVVSEGLRRGMRYSIGAEVDNDPRCRPDAQNIVDAMRPDGLIRSVHFITIDHPTEGPNYNWAFDNPEFIELFDHVGTERTWELYIATLLDAIERLPGHIVGHFYVPAIFGHWPEEENLERYEDQMLDAVAARGMAVEINTRFLYRDHPEEQRERYKAANLRLLRKAKAKGVGIAVGSDAHSPKDQGAAFDQVLALLDEAEINELVFPIAGRLARVALRATKELMERNDGIVDDSPEPQPPVVEPVDDVDEPPAPPPEPEVAPPPAPRKRPARKAPVEVPATDEPVIAAAAEEANEATTGSEPEEVTESPKPAPARKPRREPKAATVKAAPEPEEVAVVEPAPEPEPKAPPKVPAVKPSAVPARKNASKKKSEPARQPAARKVASKAAAPSSKVRAAAKARPAAKPAKPAAKKAAAKKSPPKSKRTASKRPAAKAPAPRTAARKVPKPVKTTAKRAAKPAAKKAAVKKTAAKKAATKRGR